MVTGPSTRGRRKVDMKAREVMTDTVYAFTPETPADTAAEFLTSHGYTAAPVTSEHGNLIGIVTVTDLATATSTRRRRHRRAHRHTEPPSVRDLMITPVE